MDSGITEEAIEAQVSVILTEMFPQHPESLITASIKHPSNRAVPLDEGHLLQRCIDDLLELRTLKESTLVELDDSTDAHVVGAQQTNTVPDDVIVLSQSPPRPTTTPSIFLPESRKRTWSGRRRGEYNDYQTQLSQVEDEPFFFSPQRKPKEMYNPYSPTEFVTSPEIPRDRDSPGRKKDRPNLGLVSYGSISELDSSVGIMDSPNAYPNRNALQPPDRAPSKVIPPTVEYMSGVKLKDHNANVQGGFKKLDPAPKGIDADGVSGASGEPAGIGGLYPRYLTGTPRSISNPRSPTRHSSTSPTRPSGPETVNKPAPRHRMVLHEDTEHEPAPRHRMILHEDPEHKPAPRHRMILHASEEDYYDEDYPAVDPPPWYIPRNSGGPPKNTPAAAGGPPKNLPAAATGPPKNLPAAATGPPKNLPAAATGPPKNLPAAATGPPKNLPAAATGLPKNLPAAATGPPKNLPAAATGPPKNLPAAATGLPKNLPAAAGGPPKNIPEAATGPLRNFPAGEVLRNIRTAAMGPPKNIPTAVAGPPRNIPTAAAGPPRNIPTAAAGGPPRNIPTAAAGPPRNIPVVGGLPRHIPPTGAPPVPGLEPVEPLVPILEPVIPQLPIQPPVVIGPGPEAPGPEAPVLVLPAQVAPEADANEVMAEPEMDDVEMADVVMADVEMDDVIAPDAVVPPVAPVVEAQDAIIPAHDILEIPDEVVPPGDQAQRHPFLDVNERFEDILPADILRELREDPDMQHIILNEEAQPVPAKKTAVDVYKEVCNLFPDVDNTFVVEMVNKTTHHNATDVVCNYLIENPQYPRKKAPEPKPQGPDMISTTAGGDDQTKSAASGKNYYEQYQGESVPSIYMDCCLDLLSEEFPRIAMRDIRKVAKYFSHHYAPSRKCILDGLKAAGVVTAVKDFGSDTRSVLQAFSFREKAEQKKVTFSCPVRNSSDPFEWHTLMLRCGRSYGGKGRQYRCEPKQLQDEINFIRAMNERETEVADHQMAVTMNETEYEAEGQTIECGCCYCDYPFESMVQCYEGHLFCKDCLKRYAEEAIYGQAKSTLPCMSDGCDVRFPRSQLESLPPEVLSKFEEREQAESINLANLDNLVRCPSCDFAALLDEGDKVFKCQNSSCLKETCRHCQLDWAEHFGKRCSELEKKDETQLRLAYEEKMTEAKIRTCSKCKARYTKADGCNKITCSCGSTMCYICRVPGIHYNHFCNHPRNPGHGCDKCKACSLWTNPEEDEVRAIREIQAEATKARKEQGYEDEKMIGAPDEPKKNTVRKV